MRKICVLTGTRAEYGLLKPVMGAIKEKPGLELSVIVSGMHLDERFGMTVRGIEKDGFAVDAKVPLMPESDEVASVSKAIGEGIKGMAEALERIKPDILLVLGDRMESLAGVIAAAFMNIPIAHVAGGDITKGGVDEATRHAITKFAQIHFASTKKSAERIIKMGETRDRVFIVGSPGIDTIIGERLLRKKEICNILGLNPKTPYIVMIQHPISTEPKESKRQINETLMAVDKLAYPTVIIYPNSDAGNRSIIKEIKKFGKKDFVRIVKNLRHTEYLSLLKHASALVGNSSSGITEAPSFGLPVINVGSRQEGRERAKNVIDAGYDSEEIVSAIKKALFDDAFRRVAQESKNPYGDGMTSKRIVSVLESIDINQRGFVQKSLAY